MSLLIYLIVVPLAAAFLTALLGRRFRNCGETLGVLAAGASLILSSILIKSSFLHKIMVYKIGGWLPPTGICLVADGLAVFMLFTVNLIVFFALLYALDYMKIYTGTWKFYSLFMLMSAGMNGVILSGDIFNLYVFLELASLCAYALVAFGTAPEDLEASFKYAMMGVLASLLILLGIALLYSFTSTLNMADMSLVLSARPLGAPVVFVSVLFLAGFGLKAAIVPFHAWLPDAHSSAPTPVSAGLSGVFIKTLGIYALSRIFFNVLGVSTKLLFILMFLGALSMIVGALLAIIQNDIKRMLAYSSISQVGYILLALGIGTPLALLGGLFHLFNHAVFKSLLFLNAGAIEYSTGERNLNKLGGLNSKIPVSGSTSLIASMSISGVPPFAGFWSKLIIIIACIQARYFSFAIIAGVVSIVTLAYYVKFQTFAFFGKSHEGLSRIREISPAMKLSLIILALICTAAGLMLIPALRHPLDAAVSVLSSGWGYQAAVFSAVQ